MADEDDETSGEPLDVSQDDQRTLMRGDKHAVFEVAGFPDAVRRHLGSIDLVSVPVTSGLNDDAKFAFVATPTSCFVWSYAESKSPNSSVYKLAMPDTDNATIYKTPVVALVPAGNLQSDVGVLACSTTGQIRYWDRVVFGLGGTERFHTKELSLAHAGDECCQIIEIYSGLYSVTTRKGYLFQVSLQNAQGTTELDARPLGKSAGVRAGVLSRVSSLLSGAAYTPTVVDAGDAIVGLAAGGRTEIRHSRELFALTRERLLKWVVSRAHPEKFMYSMNILQTLSNAAAQQIGMDVEVSVHDVAVTRNGDVCVLVGLQLPHRAGRTQLAVAVLRGFDISTEPEMLVLWPLNFTSTEPLEQEGVGRPRLVLPDGGPGMYIVLPKTVILSVVPTTDARFEETISFRDDDFVLGLNAASKFPYPLHQSSESSLVFTCLHAGVLEVSMEVTQILSAAIETNAADIDIDIDMDVGGASGWPQSGTRVGKPTGVGSAERAFQTQIEQAVFFGMSNSQNPLSFTISSQAQGVDGALQNAALRVSQAILDNTSHFITDRLDLGAHLKERLRRAHAIMQFIADNKLTDKVSRNARIQLCSNAERLAASVAVWEYQNEAWEKKEGAASQLMTNLVSSFLEKMGLQSRDPLRLFFKQHAASIGDLLVFMHRSLSTLRRALEVSDSGIHDSQLVAYEANRIIISVLQSGFNYRFQNTQLYEAECTQQTSEGLPERWTEHLVIIDLLAERLESSYRLCRDISGRHCVPIYERIKATTLPSDDSSSSQAGGLSIFDDAVSVSHPSQTSTGGAATNDDEARIQVEVDNPYVSSLALLRETINQMGPLANLCFRVFVDRITYLEGSSPNDVQGLTRRYESARPRYLLCLVPLGRAAVAFRLAEEYRDLATLVTLVFATDKDHAADHLRLYVSKFGKPFADTLFEYYERRQAWASLLCTQDEAFDLWLKEHIDKRMGEAQHGPMAQIGWIHDVKLGDFSAAAAKLVRAGRESSEVEQARTMLSLSKLAFVQDESQEGRSAQDETVAEAHSRLEDALELCEVQEHVAQYFAAIVREHSGLATDHAWRRRDDINDKKAALDAAMLTTTPELRHDMPALYTIYSDFVRRAWNGRTLSVEDLLDVLTLPDNITPTTELSENNGGHQYNGIMQGRRSLAVDILSRASFNLPEQCRESALRTIWRRVYLSDDWQGIHKKLKGGNVPDSVLRAELLNTQLYRMLKACWVSRELAHPDWYLLPADSFAGDDLDYLVSTRLAPQFTSRSSEPTDKQKPITNTTAPAIRKDYNEEDSRLRTAIASGLDSYYSEILRIVVEDARGQPGDEMEEKGDASSAGTVAGEDVNMDSD
ncbi:hypothetical protein GQ54DRAFT_264164 [Martensiomyces pterosporus]|nr:hypothetical protein GQ54DRAFT_264164 [Martensiomyces pterosporus]